MPRAILYREEYGEQLIEAGRQGYSPTGFAGKLGVSRQTVYDWANRHPEFADAMARAKGARVQWFETQMTNILVNGGTGGQATLLMFLLRNAGPDDYQDRKEITGADGKPLIEDSDPARVAASLLELLKGEGGRVEEKTINPPVPGNGQSRSSLQRYAREAREAAIGAGEDVPPVRRGRPPKHLSDPREPPGQGEDEPQGGEEPAPEVPAQPELTRTQLANRLRIKGFPEAQIEAELQELEPKNPAPPPVPARGKPWGFT